jgi:peptidoglycan/LPS O-acetylase OafA/YrhL
METVGPQPQHLAARGAAARHTPFRHDIEGLRALAVILVVGFHAGVPHVSGGFVGVDVFFVISGYLITALLTSELSRTGTINVPEFFARRMRRLLPAVSVVLIASLTLSFIVLPPIRTIQVSTSARAAAGYVSNLHFLALASDYFSGDVRENPILHTWSLSVEEQFYLAWPFVLLLVATPWWAKRTLSRRRLAWGLTAIALGSFLAACWYSSANRTLAFYGTPLRAWEFCCGGIVSTAVDSAGGGLRVPAWANAFLSWLGAALIVVVAMSYTSMTEFPGMTALVPVAGTVMLLIAGGSVPTLVSRGLTSVPLQWVGRRSYSWYLWHWPMFVLTAATFPDGGVAVQLAALVVGLGLADLTYRFIESPVRLPSGASMTRAGAWRTIGLGLAASAAVFSTSEFGRRVATEQSESPSQREYTTAMHDVARPYYDGCVSGTKDDRVRVCAYGSRASKRTVVLFGDSHAVQWFPALESIANDRGWSLLLIAKSRCATARVPVYEVNSPALSFDCERWRRAALDTILRRTPQLVILANASVYVGGPGVSPQTPAVVPSVWESGMINTLTLFHARGIQTVTIEDTPLQHANVPACLSRSGWIRHAAGACATDRALAFNVAFREAEERALAAVPESHRIDLTDVLCSPRSCPARLAGVIAYSDNEHLSATIVRQLAPSLNRALDEAGVAATF